MPIKVDCSCGKSLKVRDEAAGKRVKCPGCGTLIEVPGGAEEIVLTEAPKEKGSCKSCGKGNPDVTAPCLNCGWNERKQERRCLSCGGPIGITYVGSGFAGGSAVLALVFAVIFWFCFGLLLSLALLCLLTAVGGALLALTLRYDCGMCGNAVPLDALGPWESGPIQKKRKTSGILAGVLGAAMLGLILVWGTASTKPLLMVGVKEEPKEVPKKKEKPPEPKNPPGTAKVQVDNRTPNARTVWVNGDEKGTVKPYSYLEFEIPSGLYELKVTEGEKVIETFKGDIYRSTRSNPKVNVLIPGVSEYVIVDRDYGRTLPNLYKASRRERPVPEANLVVVNFGLGEPSPSFVFIPPPGTRRTTSKLVRVLPQEPTTEEVIAFFAAGPYVYTDTKGDAARALPLFLSGASEEQRRELLPRCLIPEREELIAVVTPAVSKFAHELSDDVLLGWLTTPLEGKFVRVGERERMSTVVDALLSSGRGALLGENLSGLDRQLYLIAYSKIVAADGKARRAVVEGIIKNGPGFGAGRSGSPARCRRSSIRRISRSTLSS